MEVGRPGSEPTQDWSFDLADIGAIAGNHRAAWVGDYENLTRKRPTGAPQGEDRQSGNVEGRRLIVPGVRNADVQWRFDRMVTNIGCVVARTAESGNRL